MNAEFNWWLLIVGLVVGGGLVWFVLLDARRDDEAGTPEERRAEAEWIAGVLATEGEPVPASTAERMLELHAAYLAMDDPAGPHDDDRDAPRDEPGRDPDATTPA